MNGRHATLITHRPMWGACSDFNLLDLELPDVRKAKMQIYIICIADATTFLDQNGVEIMR